MKFKSLIAVFALSLLATLMLFFNITGKIKNEKLSLVDVNDILMTASENWDGDLSKVVELADHYDLEIAVFDNKGNLLVNSASMNNIYLDGAVKDRDTICDITVKGRTAGKLIIKNEQTDIFNNMIESVELILLIFTLIITVLMTGYLMYIYMNVIRPFNRLSSFAMDVAKGNLDVPVTMDSKNIFGAFSESFDIMREELNKARDGQRRADKSKKELVASLSHDIKTPLASIKAMAELMLVSENATVNKEKAANIVNKADQIEELINNLFVSTLEELEQLKVEPDCEPSTMINDMIRTADYDHKVQDFSIPECDLYFDKLRLTQVFDNIISNSYKYAGTDIFVETEMIATHLLITIRDKGQGVDEDELPFIKQNFYRGSNASKKIGSGIGLYISDYFMKAMSGEIITENIEDGFAVIVSIKLA